MSEAIATASRQPSVTLMGANSASDDMQKSGDGPVRDSSAPLGFSDLMDQHEDNTDDSVTASNLQMSDPATRMVPLPFANVTLMSVEDAEQAMAVQRKEAENLEKRLMRLMKQNRRLLSTSGSSSGDEENTAAPGSVAGPSAGAY